MKRMGATGLDAEDREKWRQLVGINVYNKRTLYCTVLYVYLSPICKICPNNIIYKVVFKFFLISQKIKLHSKLQNVCFSYDKIITKEKLRVQIEYKNTIQDEQHEKIKPLH